MPGAAQRDRQAAYAEDAALYDLRTSMFEPWRRRLVETLPLRPGDVVLDVGCGTGLCFPLLRERVGPTGAIIGVDASAEMLDLAADRAAAAGWRNVTLEHADAADVEPGAVADHALFCAVHDVVRSGAALDAVLARVRPGGAVAAGGGKWAPGWALGVNVMVSALHAPFVRDFTGFDRPWAHLAERVADLRVEEVAMGGGYLAWGRLPDG